MGKGIVKIVLRYYFCRGGQRRLEVYISNGLSSRPSFKIMVLCVLLCLPVCLFLTRTRGQMVRDSDLGFFEKLLINQFAYQSIYF